MTNSDPRIQIKYVDTKNQLADILTKGICTRDEWNHLIQFVEHYESLDVLLHPFISFKQKVARTRCYVEERTGRNFGRKFTNGKAQIYEFGDGKTKIYFLGAVQHVEQFLLARYE